MNNVLVCILIVTTFISTCEQQQQQPCNSYTEVALKFVDQIFMKYSNTTNNNNNNTLTLEEFRKFLTSISLGNVFVGCDPKDINCRNIDLKAVHKDGELSTTNDQFDSKRRKRRSEHATEYNDGIHEKEEELHQKHWNKHVSQCLSSDSLLSMYTYNNSKSISKEDFFQLCPALLQQLDNKACQHSHFQVSEKMHNHGGPPQKLVWGYGVLSITIISLLSLSVISIIPCLKKEYYHKVMSYLVALAVGTLAGDALLHLIPHAFAQGASGVTDVEFNPEVQLQQHYSQVWRALFVLVGIYIFFLVEQLMKLKALCGGGSHGHSHGGRSSKTPTSNAGEDEKARFVTSDEEVKISNGENVLSCESDLHEIGHTNQPDIDGHYHADDRHHHHHHGEKEITKETKITSVAWMVIVGDGFHNFTDGLAVGAAFSASMSSGLSTAIAVFCHELPHELGDFAILINSGMSIKQAIVYNLVSAILAYFGLVVGILAGGNEMGRQFILSITAGLFLYVALADMLPELTNQEVPHQSRCSSYVFQHLGILSGITIMLFISLYEHIL